jgi:phosphoribosylanthranilate isomerase
MRVKICGITQIKQAQAIASVGVDTLGFICFPPSPRYLNPNEISLIVQSLPENVQTIGVFVNESLEVIKDIVLKTGLTGVQLHGQESVEFCLSLKELLPSREIIKAMRVKNPDSLREIVAYSDYVDTLLLDAYDPHLQGGTGKTLVWEDLRSFRPPLPWLLAGGLTPENIVMALTQLQPDGIDLSSGVERSRRDPLRGTPGDKDLAKVVRLWQQLQSFR